MEPKIYSISSTEANVRQDVFPCDQWTITTRKGIIMQSKCTCKNQDESSPEMSLTENKELCSICKSHQALPHIHNMPDMLFNNNVLRLEHFTGLGIEFNALDALRMVEDVKDPLQVAVAGGWQSARADFPFARKIVKPFDWTFTTPYRGTLISGTRRVKPQLTSSSVDAASGSNPGCDKQPDTNAATGETVCLKVEETDERIDVNKLKVREEILFYDDITLYEDELADHGTAQYSVKVRVMPKSLFILARFYLRVDGVLARINDTRIYHELNKGYLLREYTNREARSSSLNLSIATLVNPNELVNHLPIVGSCYEKLQLPPLR